tara:strand:+ start:856 stop:1704 length:849 start_codon:yes stop_codon:yes gene_type:complete
MSWLVNNYNKKSSKRYGWHPSWFGDHLNSFDKDLIGAIKWFQVQNELAVDGKVGPSTFRRVLASRDLKKTENYIVVNDCCIAIDWDVKIDLMPPNCYKQSRKERTPNMIVTHWDATTSADKCKRVLQARNISTHFCIDNDGVIHQYVDTNNIAWHAGGVNKYSIGIDFSNAYYLKYNNFYIKEGFKERPVCKNSRVHGIKLKPHLGYYPIQIEAYKKLLSVLCKEYNIPMQTPMLNKNTANLSVVPEAIKGKYKGVICHYHVSRNKIDCAGLDLKSITEELR